MNLDCIIWESLETISIFLKKIGGILLYSLSDVKY